MTNFEENDNINAYQINQTAMNSHKSDANIWLSLATPSFFVGLTLLQSLTQGLSQLGQMSEEVFRGERLPLLNFPDDASSQETED